jgi:uncharacterized protein YbaR (Trm112 family)
VLYSIRCHLGESEGVIVSLLDILRCPACAGATGDDPGQLDLVEGRWYVCRDCDRKYPIRDGVPVFLISEGDKYRALPVDQLPAS